MLYPFCDRTQVRGTEKVGNSLNMPFRVFFCVETGTMIAQYTGQRGHGGVCWRRGAVIAGSIW
jgi:hypothetical protein